MCLFNYLVVDYNYRSTDDQEGGELFLSSPVTFIAVVAIDFGTTFSGFAFAFNNKEGEKSIHMNKEWGSDQGYSTMKTPTCLLLNPDQSFNSFGYEAKDKFADLEEEEARQYFYFDCFKMILHNNEVREKFIFFFFQIYETSLFRRNIGKSLKDFMLINISRFWYGRKKLCYSDKCWQFVY